jgi:hypothetical protein
MVDKIEAQFVEFTGKQKQQPVSEKSLMDKDTENAIVESTKNYNKMVNNMFVMCSKICIKNFTSSTLSHSEATCVENCQKKFFASYAIGQEFIDMLVTQVNQTDLFSNNTNELDIVEKSIKKI